MKNLEETIAYIKEIAQFQHNLYECYMQHGEQGDHVHECLKYAAEYSRIAEWLEQLKRAKTLLKATYKLLDKQNEYNYDINLLEETVYYDEAECDGHCLMQDIEDWFSVNGEKMR